MKIPLFNTPIMEKVKYLEAKSRVDDRRIAELEKEVITQKRPAFKTSDIQLARIAELEKERDALKIPVVQLVAKNLALLREPNVLTGMYRMQLRDGYWSVWEPIETLKEN